LPAAPRSSIGLRRAKTARRAISRRREIVSAAISARSAPSSASGAL